MTTYEKWSLVIQAAGVLALLLTLWLYFRQLHAALIAVRGEHKKTRSEVDRELVRQASQLNDAQVRYEVQGPYSVEYAQLMSKPKDWDWRSFNAKEALFQDHLNLLTTAFQHRHLLEGHLDRFEQWGRKVILPWVGSDQELRWIHQRTLQLEDLMDPELATWLRKVLPHAGDDARS